MGLIKSALARMYVVHNGIECISEQTRVSIEQLDNKHNKIDRCLSFSYLFNQMDKIKIKIHFERGKSTFHVDILMRHQIFFFFFPICSLSILLSQNSFPI